MRYKRFISILLSLVIILTLGTSAFANGSESVRQGIARSQFKDVDSSHWANKAINWMVNKKITSGYPDATFKPGSSVTRAEFSKFLVLALELTLEKPSYSSFEDLDKSNWALPYVETAKRYLTGFRTSSGDYFKPLEQAVREDMAVALVKAKNLENETVDYTVLDIFNDKNSISPNLKKYVAIAVKHEFMLGSPVSNSDKKLFKPNGGLTRAEAASLLYNMSGEEKITYDEDKVTYDEATPPVVIVNGSKTPVVTSSVVNGKIVLSWTPVTGDGFSYYKVVISKSKSNPKYPDDGYLYCLTDINTASKVIEIGDSYNGGDIGGHLIPGQKYYFSVTSVFGDSKYAGNSLYLTCPGEVASEVPAALIAPQVTAEVAAGKIIVRWSAISDNRLQGYKVVVSKSNSAPKYPEDGYFEWITDKTRTSSVVQSGDSYNGGDFGGELNSGETYYFSITAVYGDTKIAGNAIRLTIP